MRSVMDLRAGLVNLLGVAISLIIVKSKVYETEVENDMANPP